MTDKDLVPVELIQSKTRFKKRIGFEVKERGLPTAGK